MAAFRSSVSAPRTVVSISSLSKKPYHSPSGHQSDHPGGGYRVLLCTQGRLGAHGTPRATCVAVQSDHGRATLDRSHPAAVVSGQQGDAPLRPRRLQPFAALGGACRRGRRSLLVYFRSLRLSLVAVLSARRLSGFELESAAGVHGTSGGRGLAGANRVRGIECVVRNAVPV